jgi:hypothetical protein
MLVKGQTHLSNNLLAISSQSLSPEISKHLETVGDTWEQLGEMQETLGATVNLRPSVYRSLGGVS